MYKELDLEIMCWIGRLGAATADDVAERFGLTRRNALSRLTRLVRSGLLRERRLLHGHPALFVASGPGLRVAGLERLGPCRVSVASFAHWRACARVALHLERAGDGVVLSDRELRADEREAGRRLASAELGVRPDGAPGSHHPDLVVSPQWPAGPGRERRPIAIEVELTVKAPRRLQAICRAWARNRLVEGVVYYASPPATRALRRAVAAIYAQELIEILPLGPVLGAAGSTAADECCGDAPRRVQQPSQARRRFAAGREPRTQEGSLPCPLPTSTGSR